MATYRGERRAWFQGSRLPLLQLPAEQYFEIPGRPHVVYVLKNYHSLDSAAAKALEARQEFPFLFKAFETGQIGPKRMAKISGGKPRTATIHEYLDWTVTGATAEADDELVSGKWETALPRRLLLVSSLVVRVLPPAEGSQSRRDAHLAVIGLR